MAALDFQTPTKTQAALPTTAPTEEAAVDTENSAALMELGLIPTIADWASDLWDWMWGTDEEQTPEQDPQTPDKEQPLCGADTPPDLTEAKDVSAADIRTSYANNPRAQAALDALTADPNYAKLTPEQQGGLLQRFQEAPNGATTQYLQGLAAYHTSDEKCGAGLQAYQDGLKADGGTFSANGVNYTISDGQLLDADGKVAGDIHTDGTYQLTGATERSSYYDDIHTGVSLTEGEGKDKKTLLNLHDSDPANKLTDAGMNDTFTGMITDTLRDTRRENMDMRVDSGYRSFEEQDKLYKQGRTTPGDIVTGAKGGESWHNYGTAVDIVFNDKNGRSSWPDTGEYTKMWERYGELGKDNGLVWGGDWKKRDRPHLEYHPGLGDSDASTLKDEVKHGGLEEAWDAMGIGEQEDLPPTQQTPKR